MMAGKAAVPVDNGTRLDDNVTEPATANAGDAPFDTKDPAERASTVTPQPSAEALKVGTVNGAVKVGDVAEPVHEGDVRTEEYDATKPDGTVVRVKLTLDGPDAGKSELI